MDTTEPATIASLFVPRVFMTVGKSFSHFILTGTHQCRTLRIETRPGDVTVKVQRETLAEVIDEHLGHHSCIPRTLKTSVSNEIHSPHPVLAFQVDFALRSLMLSTLPLTALIISAFVTFFRISRYEISGERRLVRHLAYVTVVRRSKSAPSVFGN
ncbi:uncharacterized protein EI90DRAFT_1818590 [Cantharellus anzutake]|uniref:uncharacterized protein n=1 Tax=Cantharellus anzutake TaxID=1750568 RepID=UPI001904145E|nr:uncharacterized protein EI90DRAFT_1818590 [Cantharellus anzutake]KAF8327138.1 hypothetical protein EI90DRAFT_1818590 [Cantharellus anzutake]